MLIIIIIIIIINIYNYIFISVYLYLLHVITKLPNSKFKIKNSKFFQSQMIEVLKKHYMYQSGCNLKNGHTARTCPRAQK